MSHYLNFREELTRKIKETGRDVKEISLIAASKYFDADQIRKIYEMGQRDFGENRLQDALPKMEALKDLPITWHFFGHIQTNKAKKIVENFLVVHSLDSLKLGQMLDRYSLEMGKKLKVFLQVNLAHEEAKSGYEKEDLLRDFGELKTLKHLEILGLMIITPLYEDPSATRPLFRELKLLQEELNAKHLTAMKSLSMGMSTDWPFALKEGATHLRVGRALI